MSQAYCEDEQGGEKRIFLKFPSHLAPVKVAVLPLVKNKPELTAKAREVYKKLQKEVGSVMWVDSGNIGKNYRRMDEIGVPHCITIDFQTLEDDTVTVRNRDTTEQTRQNISDISV
jgi:glycyl-tRNA synthetase